MINKRFEWWRQVLLAAVLSSSMGLSACGGSSSSTATVSEDSSSADDSTTSTDDSTTSTDDSTTSTDDSTTSTDDSTTSTDDSTTSTDDSTTSTDDSTTSADDSSTTDDSSSTDTTDACSSSVYINELVCSVDTFMATLSSSQQASLMYDWSDSQARTIWSNLPTNSVQRNGLKFGSLSSTQLAAVMAVAKLALSDEGYEDFVGIMAADDYLRSQGGGSVYSSDNYYIAIFGTPAVSGSWAMQIGGHHAAYNVTWLSGTGYPMPTLTAAEPKGSFTYNSETYAPMQEEGDALVAVFDALSSDELSTAYLSGQSFSDVLVGPDNGSGELPTDYPTGSKRDGLLVSYLSASQQALVVAAIEQWVRDFPDAVADDLMAEYTSDAAFADTYIAWAGSSSSSINTDRSGTYLRIDGPRLWIELACQGGIVLSGTHFHTIYRDKSMDYGNSL